MDECFFKNWLPLAIFFVSAPAWSSLDNRIDDKQIKIMYWPELEVKQTLQFDFEVSTVDEKVNSAVDGAEVTTRELPTYAVSIGSGLLSNLRGGIQFGSTRIILLNFSLNFNLQYDLYKSERFLLSLVTMYGGVLFPGERYGAKAFLSYQRKGFNYYFGIERIKSNRYFQYGFRNEGSFKLHNFLDYNLVNDIYTVGVRSNKIGELLGNNSVSLDLSVGFSKDVELNYSNAKYEPANFHREDGYIFSGSWIVFY